ncbi:MAG: 2,3-cyclic-nucleotide 2-phosphodiesterase [Fusobacteriaceae bacterium]|jgi:metallophosphoesterase (TIGR00282 family)|nr:metallophosphoesterase [Fusobacteriales bacterium]MDN5303497.1 2,3-cyclic-nucleotide 2-phosphodiesterase [Fusobacteriaceae bacterium]
MKILIIGDVIGNPGRKILYEFLERKKEEYDFIIVNGENAAAGFGITIKIADEFFQHGVDVITSGNHIWDKKEIYKYLDENNSLLRPLNYPKGVPGSGYVIKESKTGEKIAVVNLQGRVFMPLVDSPFEIVESALNEIKKETDIIIVDFHAEATSEKVALGWFLDGKVKAVYGTHTHIQTADNRILNEGTAYITDIGMTGSHDSVIGMTVETILPKFLNSLPSKFEIGKNNIRLNGVELILDNNKNVKEFNRIDISLEELDFI